MQRSTYTITLNSANGARPQAGSSPIAEHTVALTSIGRVLRVLLASKEGYLYIYNLPGNSVILIIGYSKRFLLRFCFQTPPIAVPSAF